MLSGCGVGEDSWESLTARRSNQSVLKEISPEYSLEGLMLRLKFQYFGHLTWRTDSLEKTLMLEKIEGKRIRRWQRMMVWWHHWLNGHEFSKLWEIVKDREGHTTLQYLQSELLWSTGPFRRNILSGSSPLGVYLGRAFLEQPEGMEKSRKERIKLLACSSSWGRKESDMT